jgi:hypothetical protein
MHEDLGTAHCLHVCCHSLSAPRCTYVGGHEVVGIDTGIRRAAGDRSNVRTGLLEPSNHCSACAFGASGDDGAAAVQ